MNHPGVRREYDGSTTGGLRKGFPYGSFQPLRRERRELRNFQTYVLYEVTQNHIFCTSFTSNYSFFTLLTLPPASTGHSTGLRRVSDGDPQSYYPFLKTQCPVNGTKTSREALFLLPVPGVRVTEYVNVLSRRFTSPGFLCLRGVFRH